MRLSPPSVISESITTIKTKPPTKEDEAGSSTGNHPETDWRQPMKTKFKLHIPLTWMVWAPIWAELKFISNSSPRKGETHNYTNTGRYFRTISFLFVCFSVKHAQWLEEPGTNKPSANNKSQSGLASWGTFLNHIHLHQLQPLAYLNRETCPPVSFFLSLAMPHGMQDLSSRTRDWTCTPAMEA